MMSQQLLCACFFSNWGERKRQRPRERKTETERETDRERDRERVDSDPEKDLVLPRWFIVKEIAFFSLSLVSAMSRNDKERLR